MNEIYIEFLRFCLNPDSPLPENAKGIDWEKMMGWAEEQAIAGIVYEGVLKAGKSLNIPFDVLMKWTGYANRIELRNKLVNNRCVELTENLSKDGFKCCVLKGQGNALMYPNPYSRTPGDIDIWCLTPNPSPKGEGSNVRNIINYVKRKNPGAKATYHHVDYGAFKGVEVEVHYRPSFMNSLIYNRRLQRWMQCHAEIAESAEMPEGGRIPVPTWEFNVVFQLSHIYKHVIEGGIGLKQLIDYYYLLKANKELEEVRGSYRSAQGVKGQYHETLGKLGLMEIAGAVMWVLHTQLGLEEEYLIAAVDERRGRFLLAEIIRGGNFGQYFSQKSQKWIKADSALGNNIRRLKRDMKLVRYFPSECLWEPVFRWYHFFWRMVH